MTVTGVERIAARRRVSVMSSAGRQAQARQVGLAVLSAAQVADVRYHERSDDRQRLMAFFWDAPECDTFALELSRLSEIGAMRIFVGSSTEALDHVRQIAAWIEEAGHQPLPWDTPDLFLPGENTNIKLLEISKSVDAAVFIFSEDDTIWYRQDALRQPRDNVLLEYGLFCGAVGFKKCIICRFEKPKVASDLAGLTYLNISEGSINNARVRFLHWIRSLSSQEADPAISELLQQRAVLRHEIQTLQAQLDFEKTASTELRERISRDKTDLSEDWQLLFEFKYYWTLVDILWKAYSTPEEWRIWLQAHGFDRLHDMINWEQPYNVSRGKFMIAKTLSAIRTYDYGDTYNALLQQLTEDVREKIAAIPRPVAGLA
jgi:predicted nucleotide-binding protein